MHTQRLDINISIGAKENLQFLMPLTLCKYANCQLSSNQNKNSTMYGELWKNLYVGCAFFVRT